MTESQPILCSKMSPPVVCSCKGSFTIEDAELLKKIKSITAHGHDVEIRPKGNGKLAVYEIKKKSV